MWRIKQWDEHHENSRSREVAALKWVSIPNKQDGDGYLALLGHAEGVAHYGCFVAILLLASKCPQPRIGELRKSNGQPHSVESIAQKIHMSPALVQATLTRCASVEVGWVEWVEDVQDVQGLFPERESDGSAGAVRSESRPGADDRTAALAAGRLSVAIKDVKPVTIKTADACRSERQMTADGIGSRVRSLPRRSGNGNGNGSEEEEEGGPASPLGPPAPPQAATPTARPPAPEPEPRTIDDAGTPEWPWFRCAAGKASKRRLWRLTEVHLDQLGEGYPNVDVEASLREMHRRHVREKRLHTADGMPRACEAWLANELRWAKRHVTGPTAGPTRAAGPATDDEAQRRAKVQEAMAALERERNGQEVTRAG